MLDGTVPFEGLPLPTIPRQTSAFGLKLKRRTRIGARGAAVTLSVGDTAVGDTAFTNGAAVE
eukprot:scaffold76744_cov67-Phaeocystis_antarctica.AAC.15